MEFYLQNFFNEVSGLNPDNVEEYKVLRRQLDKDVKVIPEQYKPMVSRLDEKFGLNTTPLGMKRRI